jgi:hypothetical protein
MAGEMMGAMRSGLLGLSAKYTASPLVVHDRAIETAAALLLLGVARESINFELRRNFALTEGQAAAVIREASGREQHRVKALPARRRDR